MLSWSILIPFCSLANCISYFISVPVITVYVFSEFFCFVFLFMFHASMGYKINVCTYVIIRFYQISVLSYSLIQLWPYSPSRMFRYFQLIMAIWPFDLNILFCAITDISPNFYLVYISCGLTNLNMQKIRQNVLRLLSRRSAKQNNFSDCFFFNWIKPIVYKTHKPYSL